MGFGGTRLIKSENGSGVNAGVLHCSWTTATGTWPIQSDIHKGGHGLKSASQNLTMKRAQQCPMKY